MLLFHAVLQGCYQAAQDYLIYDTVSWFGILVGVGSTIAILLVSRNYVMLSFTRLILTQ